VTRKVDTSKHIVKPFGSGRSYSPLIGEAARELAV
jgi:hypothetical protein